MFELWAAWGFVQENWWWLIGAAVAVGVMLFLAYTARSWKLLLEGLAGLAVIIASARFFRAGAKAERERQAAASERVHRRVEAAKADVRAKDDAEIDATIDRWIGKDRS